MTTPVKQLLKECALPASICLGTRFILKKYNPFWTSFLLTYFFAKGAYHLNGTIKSKVYEWNKGNLEGKTSSWQKFLKGTFFVTTLASLYFTHRPKLLLFLGFVSAGANVLQKMPPKEDPSNKTL
jgi:hypothetical protein